VWVNTGRVIVDNWWDVTWTILVFKTTSGDNVKFLYWDDWKLYIDNGTWSFKQIYVKWEVDALLALKQDLLTAWAWINIDANNVISSTAIAIFSSTAPSNPIGWMLWYDTTASAMKIYDGTNQTWIAIWWSSPTPPTPTGDYRYIKWHVTATWDTWDPSDQLYQIMASRFVLTDGVNEMSYPVGTTASTNGTNDWSDYWETPDRLLDGSTSTKMVVGWEESPYSPLDVIIDLGSWNGFDPTVYDHYQWYTANDSFWWVEVRRNPVSWEIQLSEDGSTWEVWDTQTNATLNEQNESIAWTWTLTDPTNL
jgi:hypothetical protein